MFFIDKISKTIKPSNNKKLWESNNGKGEQKITIEMGKKLSRTETTERGD